MSTTNECRLSVIERVARTLLQHGGRAGGNQNDRSDTDEVAPSTAQRSTLTVT